MSFFIFRNTVKIIMQRFFKLHCLVKYRYLRFEEILNAIAHGFFVFKNRTSKNRFYHTSNLAEPVSSSFTFLSFLSLFKFLSLCYELFGSFYAFLFLFL